MAARKILTDTGIRAAIAKAKKTGRAVWTADGAIPRSHGGLQLYAHPGGAPRWYWRYTKPDGTKDRLALGTYTFEGGDGETTFTLTQAREAVAQKAALYREPESHDVRAHLEREAQRDAEAKEAAERERQAAATAATAAGQHTLDRLLAAYAAQLTKQGKISGQAAAAMFRKHVTTAHPSLAARQARDVTGRDVATILRTLTEAGHGRQAAKLRAYLRAAYALAARAALDPDAPAAFIPFNVEANPVAATATLAQFNRALDRTLSEPELREYWAALKAEPDSALRDALLLSLLLGGQRTAQLLRATVADVDAHAKLLRLRDTKGRRKQARLHVVPVSDLAMPAIARCLARAEAHGSQWLFSTYGKVPLRPEMAAQAAGAIAAALLAKPKAQRVVREPFQLRNIRRTCETALARMGISKDVRAQIQSHGLGGVQARHYDRHDYMPEKAAALAAWAAFLETAPADNVAPIGERRARRGGTRGR